MRPFPTFAAAKPPLLQKFFNDQLTNTIYNEKTNFYFVNEMQIYVFVQ
jgi:hypothetical protein